MTPSEAIDRAVQEEMMRRVRFEEGILRQALAAGAASVDINWPDHDVTLRHILPTTAWARRRLVRRVERISR